ncbi:hypothetical protein DV736_g3458, partial [Chaetothyriales sp. CBS 134916]
MIDAVDYGATTSSAQYHTLSYTWDSQTSLSPQTSNDIYNEGFDQRYPNLSQNLEPRHQRRRKALYEAARDGGAWSVQTVLSLDGGGIRGLSTLLIIRELMLEIADIEKNPWPSAKTSGDSEQLDSANVQREMRELLQQVPSQKGGGQQASSSSSGEEFEFLPCHYFDYMAGTSTGGLIATMLGRMWMSADRTLHEFKALTADVYGVRYRSTSRMLKTFLFRDLKQAEEDRVKKLVSARFGDRPLLLQDSDRCKTILCSLEEHSGKSGREPYVFRSYKNSDPSNLSSSEKTKPEVYTLTQVMHATACNPYYYTSVPIGSRKFCDAGLSWTNPTGQVWREVRKQSHHELPSCLVLSVGCGYDTAAKDEKSSKKRTYRVWQQHRSRLLRTSDKVNSSLAAVSELTHAYMEKLFEEQLNMQYVRLNATLNLSEAASHRLHSWQDEIAVLQQQIEEKTRLYLNEAEVRKKIKQCAESLVDLRRRRSRTASWEAFAFGVRYRCKADENCSEKNKYFGRLELKHHLRDAPEHHKDDDDNIKTLMEKGRTRSDKSK